MNVKSDVEIALLTGGGDRPYAFGLATALLSKSLILDLIGGDELDSPEWHGTSQVNFLNLRGDQRSDASRASKVSRVLRYYARLIRYAATARPKIFHILWNNKFELFDRVLLMLYYKLLRKKIVLTVHNVNAKKRDLNDTLLNRLTLKIQYRLTDHLFVHTKKMKCELIEEFGISASAITVIPFGINNAVPNTNLTCDMARRRLGIAEKDRAILFFGNIAPYKGLEYLVDAFQQVVTRNGSYRLIIAGNIKDCATYWNDIQETITREVEGGQILLKIEYIPDSETEVYFKAADLLVLPYRHIYQSGVLFLGYSFGLPVVATDVGALREEIIEGKTGFVCRPDDSGDLARAIETYFSSDLYKDLNNRRQEIRKYALERHSWDVVSESTGRVYRQLLGEQLLENRCRASSSRQPTRVVPITAGVSGRRKWVHIRNPV
jgi:glycosyltransferase involved in cell wall biosynthesis